MSVLPFPQSFRSRFFAGFLVCAALLGYGFYSQFVTGLEPCPLCIFQRLAFAAVAIVFLAGALHGPTRTGARRVYGVLGLLATGIGIAIAGRHVWLQHLPPDQVPACGPNLDYMLEAMPLAGVVRKVLTGSGECAKVDWTFLGLSMPEWSLVWFVLLAGWVMLAAFRRRG